LLYIVLILRSGDTASERFFMLPEHSQYIQRTLELAQEAQGHTSPNPMVGAVIVHNGQIIGEGYHHRAGLPHAEVEALNSVKGSTQGATMYVTLEPCNHQGRTPPCTETIIAAGITHVVYAIDDPNPFASGGAERLREAGIQVTAGICMEEAAYLNRFFLHHVRTGLPYVIAKYAMSLDGKIATHEGDSQWITSEAARHRAHQLRHAIDAILVGTGTALADNPRLTTRLSIDNPKHPLRVVLDSTGKIPLKNQLFSPGLPGQTLVATTDAMPQKHEAQLKQNGVEVLRLPKDGWNQVDLLSLLQALGQCGMQSVMAEGGGTLLGALFDEDRVNEVWAFVAPIIIGGDDAPSPIGGFGVPLMSHAPRLHDVVVEQLGADVLMRGVVDEEK
jgi:diaminohydroxyphosphoribosylaminopyrimidine deaminase / 5-amino-6-(5-phosphoribosylamino)uracil reductase